MMLIKSTDLRYLLGVASSTLTNWYRKGIMDRISLIGNGRGGRVCFYMIDRKVIQELKKLASDPYSTLELEYVEELEDMLKRIDPDDNRSLEEELKRISMFRKEDIK